MDNFTHKHALAYIHICTHTWALHTQTCGDIYVHIHTYWHTHGHLHTKTQEIKIKKTSMPGQEEALGPWMIRSLLQNLASSSKNDSSHRSVVRG